ncbi:GerAB/ArcD/ProY family transporter [Neobacillus jeddahensis]|uniref:GerAB/ArcD/ProY family transporter n=1 Tax=Neobacillus jeddahensis TaxID=1461580 RepID=UPI000590A955|nr:endospore germination permease [Neobacillus jeddahensis]
MERISLYQLFALTFFFQIGTTIILGFGASAGKDAWIVNILSVLLGLTAIGIFLLLKSFHEGLTLVEWFPAGFGKWLGTPIAWLYPLLFLYEMGRVLNDIKYLLQTILFPGMPTWGIVIPFLIVSAYGVFKGIEVIGRVGEFIFPLFFMLFIILIIFIMSSDIVKIENLRPVLEDGWAPIWNASFPLGASQGFAQTLELAMIWPLVHAKAKHIAYATLWATLLSGAVILVSQLFIIAGLGGVRFQFQIYPMYALIKKIQIGEFIQNVDVIGVMFFVITAYFKGSLHMYFALRAIQLLTKTKNSHPWIIPLIFIGILLGYVVSTNIQEHLKIAIEVVPFALWIPLLWILPLLLLIATVIKRSW